MSDRELIGLLRREGRHSGIWCGDRLIEAADRLESLNGERDRVIEECVVTLGDAFEMGFAWAMKLRGQTLEDSRAVGRTLYQDIFEPIAEQIDEIIKRDGFDSFKPADHGIAAAKAIICGALRSLKTGGR